MAAAQDNKQPLLGPSEDGSRYELFSPTALPQAGGFLWNQRMMIQMTCRGYAVAQFMQPEPAKYAHAPNLEARTFMQPEQGYYAHHPGRFVYIREDGDAEGDAGELLFSAPYEPVRAPLDTFVFSAGKADLSWRVEARGVRVEMTLVVPTHDVAELWTVKVTNTTDRARRLSVVPYFPIGYMSWMNQGASYREDLGGVVGTSITPYQKAADYFKNRDLKDKTYFLCETAPDAWEARQDAFEGEGGLHRPSALDAPLLSNSDALYETPTAAVQYRAELAAGETREYRFLFGPAKDDAEIVAMRDRYLSAEGFATTARAYADYIEAGRGCLRIETPDAALDNLVNHWLPRQCYYHGDVNRLTTDPQTRNYLQDNMGMSYIKPDVARAALVTALSQQEASGAMPDGILLVPGAELKYINQIPHTDHCVWLPVALEIYLAETGDYALLDEAVPGADGRSDTAGERFGRAMDWLLSPAARDARGLSYIAQGDWCDPMNMAGWKGRGVSGWLTVATAHALGLWATVCAARGRADDAARYRAGAAEVNAAANAHFWNGAWFARGITDDGVAFGVQSDREGRFWLNPQAWALLGGAAATPEQRAAMLAGVDEHLDSPYGPAMFAPPFTAMREDVGRVTQKYPGQGENGSVYNHAAVFYIWSLYALGGGSAPGEKKEDGSGSGANEADRAYRHLRQMVPGPDEADYRQRGQLPVFVPNYYRGGWRERPRTAGRSSQLFNTGTVSWLYRCVIEGLCGLRGEPDGLRLAPQLPAHWDGLRAERRFRGATFRVDIRRADVADVTVRHGDVTLPGARVVDIKPGAEYDLTVLVPRA